MESIPFVEAVKYDGEVVLWRDGYLPLAVRCERSHDENDLSNNHIQYRSIKSHRFTSVARSGFGESPWIIYWC